MFIRFLKKIIIVIVLAFAAQGCAVYVADDDDFYHSRRFHRHWEHEHSSLQQNQVAENGKVTPLSDMDAGKKQQNRM